MNRQQPIHDYHLMIDAELKQKICSIQDFNNLSFTDRTRFILKTCSFVAYEYYQGIKKLNSLIPAKMDGPVDAHVYFPVCEYQSLKEKHGGHNTFSVAVLVRTVMRLFLEGIEQFGFVRFVAKMKKLKENMDKPQQEKIRSVIQTIGRHMCALFEKQTQLFAEFLFGLVIYLLM